MSLRPPDSPHAFVSHQSLGWLLRFTILLQTDE